MAWRGNFYSVPPELARGSVTGSQRLGADQLEIATASGIVLAKHQAAPHGAGVMVRDHGHVIALEAAVLAAHTTAAPHRKKERIPPGPAARAAAEALRTRTTTEADVALGAEVVIGPAKYAHAAEGRNTLP